MSSRQIEEVLFHSDVTLIACLDPESAPVILSDRLLSGNHEREDVELPTVGVYHRLVEPRNEPNRLWVYGQHQKLICVGDTVLVAWAGYYSEAMTLLRALSLKFKDQSPSVGDVVSELETTHSTCLKEGRLRLIVASGSQGKDQVWFSGCDLITTKDRRKAIVGGSGANAARRMLEITNINGRAVNAALMLFATLFAQEMINEETLKDNFGSGYDIGYFDRGKATVLSEYTYILWSLDGVRGDDALKCRPTRIYKSFSVDDQVCLYVVDIFTCGTAMRFSNQRVFIVSNAIREADMIGADWESRIGNLNTGWQINTFCLSSAGQAIGIIPVITNDSNPAQRPVIFEDNFWKEGKSLTVNNAAIEATAWHIARQILDDATDDQQS